MGNCFSCGQAVSKEIAVLKHSEPGFRSFDEIAPWLETGDLVLLCSVGLPAWIVKTFTRSEWSHVGIIERRYTPEGDYIYLWECIKHADDCLDETLKVRKGGVRKVDLWNKLIKHPPLYMGVVKLRWPSPEALKESMQRFQEFTNREHTKEYEEDLTTLIRIGIDFSPLGHNKPDTSRYFCSEFVAEVYKSMGILGEQFPSHECAPEDFFSYDFPFSRDVTVATLFYVEPPPRDESLKEDDASEQLVKQRQQQQQLFQTPPSQLQMRQQQQQQPHSNNVNYPLDYETAMYGFTGVYPVNFNNKEKNY